VRAFDGCSLDTALCQDNVLRLGTVRTDTCVGHGMYQSYCASHVSKCCISLWGCDATAPSGLVSTICSPGCEALVASETRIYPACPGSAIGWPSAGGLAACSGDFFCDALGTPLGPDHVAKFDVGSTSVHWCENGVLQQVNLRPFGW
jgi:hypothetical protein